ncbi:MAG: hypothetical protein AAF555_07600 [Verrucomicrobiota bacterium]
MFSFLLVVGIFVLAFACRTFAEPRLRRLGAVGLVVGSFLAGYFLVGIWLGVLAALVWFCLPWYEILTRIRHLRLPLDKRFREGRAPMAEIAEPLQHLSGEVEESHFRFVADFGWDWQDMRHFFRIYYHSEKRMQATIAALEQNGLTFLFLSVSNRTTDGQVLRTWNYPFSYTLAHPPALKLQRATDIRTFEDLLLRHELHLSRNQVGDTKIREIDETQFREEMEKEILQQTDYNLQNGLIVKADETTFRYSWRGLVYLWRQFLIDLLKYS